MLYPLPEAAPVAEPRAECGAEHGAQRASATLPHCHHVALHVPRTVGVTHPNESWDAEEPVVTPPLQAAAEQSPWRGLPFVQGLWGWVSPVALTLL